MSLKRRVLAGFGLMLMACMTTFAHAGLLIYPSRAVLGLDEGCRQTNVPASPASPAIDCAFLEAVQTGDFLDGVRKSFGTQISQDFAGAYTAEITPRNKARTFVASLDVVRASRYFVMKESTAEIFLPVTVALKLTNILTGEVILAVSLTQTQPLKVMADEISSQTTQEAVANAYRQSFASLVSQLAGRLKGQLQLEQVDVPLVEIWKSYYVLGKGLDQGIGAGDELSASDGSLLRIAYSDVGYSIGVPVLLAASAEKPVIFSKMSGSMSKAVRKPKVLVADILTTAGESRDLVEQIFADALGDKAAFTLMLVNRRYGKLAVAVSQETGLAQQQDVQQRALPDLFIRLVVLPSVAYNQAVGQITEMQVMQTRVMGELVDGAGRVIFSAIGIDKKQEQVSAGMGFALENRQEVSLKNALLNLADQFASGVRFAKADLMLAEVRDDTVMVTDPDERLSPGMGIKIYRMRKTDAGQVLAPIWEAQVVRREGLNVVAGLVLPIVGDNQNAIRPAAGDSILLESGSGGGSFDKAMVFCAGAKEASLGTINFDHVSPLAYNALANRAKRPLFASGGSIQGQYPLSMAVQELTRNAGFRGDLLPRFFSPQQSCLQPVYRIEQKAESCAEGKGCEVELLVVAGVRQVDASGVPQKPVGFAQTLHVAGVMPENRDAIYRIQFLESIPALLDKVAMSPEFSPLSK